jgi:3-oxoadipate enol-lactonase
MPFFRSSPDLEMYYREDDYTDPWTQPDAILMLHGNCESSQAWYGWVPHLGSRFRVVRPDMRGFGRSTPMRRDFAWTLDIVIEDYLRLMDALGIERFHLVGAKIGGTVARAFAARQAARVLTLTVVGTPPPFREGSVERIPEWIRDMKENGVEPRVRRGMAARLGTSFPPEGVEWWIRYMGRTSVETQIGWISKMACADITEDVRRIKCPTLVITTEESGLATIEENRAWQEQIPNSRLLVLPGNSYHAAVTDAKACARATLDFIIESGTSALKKQGMFISGLS